MKWYWCAHRITHVLYLPADAKKALGQCEWKAINHVFHFSCVCVFADWNTSAPIEDNQASGKEPFINNLCFEKFLRSWKSIGMRSNPSSVCHAKMPLNIKAVSNQFTKWKLPAPKVVTKLSIDSVNDISYFFVENPQNSNDTWNKVGTREPKWEH